LGYVGLALFLPGVVLMFPSGDLADRFDRRFILAAAYSMLGLCAASFTILTYTGGWPVWAYYIVLVLLGSSNALGRPSSQSFIAQIVPRAQLQNALAWGSMANKTATIVGPSAGGILYLLGPSVVFGVATAIYAMAVCVMLLVRGSIKTREPAGQASGWRRF